MYVWPHPKQLPLPTPRKDGDCIALAIPIPSFAERHANTEPSPEIIPPLHNVLRPVRIRPSLIIHPRPRPRPCSDRPTARHGFVSAFHPIPCQSAWPMQLLTRPFTKRQNMKKEKRKPHYFFNVEYPSKLLSACTSRLTSNPNLCVGMSCSGRAPLLLGDRELLRGGGCPSLPALSIAEMLGMV